MNDKGVFSFASLTPEERARIDQKKRDIEEKSKATSEALSHCLNSDSFAKYRKEYEESNNALMEKGIYILKTVRNPEERLFLYDTIFTRADVLGLLLKKVMNEKQ